MSIPSDRAESEEAPPANWILQHPAFRQMKELQVGDSEQIYAAFLVYMDLTEGLEQGSLQRLQSVQIAGVHELTRAKRLRRWREVSCVKSPDLQVVLLEAREKDGAPVHTVLPLPVHRCLNHRSIRQVMDRGFPTLLCAVASDSTLVYQRMTDGLVTPDPPAGPFEDVGRRHQRKRRQQQR